MNILLGQKAQLDGSASSDPDAWPSALTYQWSFVSVPAGSTLVNADIDRADTSTPSFVPDKEGVYVLQLAVNDGANSAADNVSVTVSRTASLCAVLGKDGDRRFDVHLYRFTGKKGEGRRPSRASPEASGAGKRATLVLISSSLRHPLYMTDSSALPNQVTAKLPVKGDYYIGVLEQVRFRG